MQWDASPLSWASMDSAAGFLANPTGALSSAATQVFQGLAQTRNRCEGAGYLLADAIARLEDEKRVVLLGHSLGACVIYHALTWLAKSRNFFERTESKVDVGSASSGRRVDRAVLLGSACPAVRRAEEWELAAGETERGMWNLWSDKDEVLSGLGCMLGSPRAGVCGIQKTSEMAVKIKNVECSEVCGHLDWKSSVASVRLLD
ncbi:hypothetical protein BC830DRAFT_870354 [Chytriomyces sp. MP71]|nr:hypothetical protein BC830DRAFT_870354 [Chytriomyces sp. MP71]